MKKKFLFISCDEAKIICDKTQYNEATIWERITLRIRFAWCNVTRSYSKNNTKLTKAVKKAEVNCLKNEERETIKQQLEDALTKH